MKKIIIVIHGGDFFPSKEAYIAHLQTKEVFLDRMRFTPDWKKNLQGALGDGYDVFLPHMPTADNAEYELWKIWFERTFEVISKPCIFVGHSLGAMFLIKYLTENLLPYKPEGLFLVAPEFLHSDEEKAKDSSFAICQDASRLLEQTKRVTFFFSKDDPVVSFENSYKFKKYIPRAQFEVFEDRSHFFDATFPEIAQHIKEISNV